MSSSFRESKRLVVWWNSHCRSRRADSGREQTISTAICAATTMDLVLRVATDIRIHDSPVVL